MKKYRIIIELNEASEFVDNVDSYLDGLADYLFEICGATLEQTESIDGKIEEVE